MGINEIPERALNAPLPARIVIVIILFSIGLMAGLVMAEDKFGFIWTPLIESISHKEYLIRTDKTANIDESFSVFFNETSFPPEELRNIRLYIEKSFTYNETIFILEEQETIEKIGYKWNEIGFITKEKTNKDAKIKYDIKKFKKHDRYKLVFDTPIRATGTGFGSTGLVAFLADGEIHHPLWDTTGWTKYKEINITNNIASDLSNYQIFLNVTYAASMQAGFGDLRFVWVNNSDSTDERELNYYIENKVDSNYADIWINNTYLPASANVLVKMFYNNSDVSSISNGNKTLLGFATGGNITRFNSTRVHTFTNNGTFAPEKSLTTKVLIVAGAGAGGHEFGGGGGAGGLIYNASYIASSNASVVVGAGGQDGTQRGESGYNSSFANHEAVGGGGGGRNSCDGGLCNGDNGGSGGGGSGSGAAGYGGNGTADQGNDGGDNFPASPAYGSGGGGGAGAVGATGTSTTGGNGGSGLSYNINGSDVFYAAGGAGATYNQQGTPGTGGSSCGGTAYTNADGDAGLDRGCGGGGGGGSAADHKDGGAGGKGLVIISYAFKEEIATEPTYVFGSEQDVPLADPIVKLTFDLANGLDASGHGNNATTDNAQWVYSDKCAGAYNITTTEQIGLFTTMLNKTYDSFAYCMRAKSVEYGGTAGGVILDASTGIIEPRKLLLIRYDDGRIYYTINNVTENYNTTDPYGEWESFCLSSNGTNQRFYFNGAGVHNSSNIESFAFNNSLRLGNPWPPGNYFHGQIDDFYFWNRTISAAEALSFNVSCDSTLDLAAYDATTNESLAGYALNISNAGYGNIPNTLNLTLAPGNYSLVFSLANYSSKSADVELVTVLFYNASLYPLKLFECGIFEDVIPTLNFSVYDEEVLTELNGTIELVFNLLEEGFYATNQSWNLTSTPLTICIPENITYLITDSIIQYTAPDHLLRHYFLVNFSINSTMQTIPLYSLATANGTEITINIQDAAGAAVSDAIIIFQRYYIGEDVYRAVAMARTDYNGRAVTNVRQDDVWHKLLILKDLIVRRTIDRMIITETTLNIPYIDEGLGQAFYNYYNNIATTCTANNTIVICTATDTTGATQTFQLDVYRIGYNNVGRVLTCTDTETSSSVTLSCAVSHNNSYYTLSAVGSHYRLNDGYIHTPAAIYGVNGVVLAAGVVMTMVGIGTFNPVAAIGLGLVGLILAVLADVVVMKVAALISIILVGIILIAKMRG